MDGQGKTYIDPIRNSEKASIRPALPGDKSREKDLQKTKRAENAASDLRAAEKNASTSSEEVADSVTGARSNEENVNRLYNGTGKKVKGKFGGKKATGFIGIIIAIFGGGAALFGSQGFQAFSLVNNLMSNFDSSSYSSNARLFNMLRSAVKGNSKVKSTSELSDALESTGVTVNADADGNIESLTEVSTGKTYGASDIDVALDGDLKSNISKASETIDIDSTYTSKAKTYAADRIDWNKNRYADYDSDTSTKTSTDTDSFIEVAYGKSKSTEIDGAEQVLEEETYTDENGDKHTDTELVPETTIDETVEAGKNIDAASAKSTLTEIGNKVSTVSRVACIYATVATAVSAISIGQQILSMINMSSGYMEATQKVQAGVGNGSSFNEYQNLTNTLGEDGKGFWTSTSIRSIFGDDTGTQSAGAANLENIFSNNAVLAAGVSTTAWKTCIGSAMLSSSIAILTAGIGTLAQIAINAVVGSVTEELMDIVTPIVTTALASMLIDPILNMGSEEAGDYTVSGADIILATTARASGLSAGTDEKVAEFETYKDSVIASRAEYDRETLSPFDMTNKNTFLGSIAYSLISFSVLNSSKTVTSLIGATSTIVNESLLALSPVASAVNYNNITNYTSENCPLLNTTGATGSSLHCNYYSIADVDSFDITYDEAVEYLCGHNNLKNCDSTPTVVSGSELAKYIEFWTTRDSHLGLADSGVTAALTITSENSAIDGAIGAVPIVGDAVDLLNAGIQAANSDYIFGSAYVAGGEFWNEHPEMKYIQAYLELDTLYSDLAIIETSTLATYLDDYYERNPIDNSYEGKLARFSGLEKDEVIAVLDYLEYEEYIANYDPSSRYNFVAEAGKTSVEKIADLSLSRLVIEESELPESSYAKLAKLEFEMRREVAVASL